MNGTPFKFFLKLNIFDTFLQRSVKFSALNRLNIFFLINNP